MDEDPIVSEVRRIRESVNLATNDSTLSESQQETALSILHFLLGAPLGIEKTAGGAGFHTWFGRFIR
jgi:hypothetical protein